MSSNQIVYHKYNMYSAHAYNVYIMYNIMIGIAQLSWMFSAVLKKAVNPNQTDNNRTTQKQKKMFKFSTT